MKHQSIITFDLFWDANRANEHKQSRALGLLEKMLLETPDDMFALACKACLLIQMSHDWDRAENRSSAISVALGIIQEANLIMPDDTRYQMEFAVGISLAQLPTAAGFDTASIGILEHLESNPAFHTIFDITQQQEVLVALSAVYQANGNAVDARDVFVKGRQHEVAKAADTFEDYQQLKSLVFLG